jgi:hypothetical protein
MVTFSSLEVSGNEVFESECTSAVEGDGDGDLVDLSGD